MMQDLVVYCNATQNQFYGDSAVNYNTQVFAVQTPATTDNAINCCLRCAFSNSCNIWWVLYSLVYYKHGCCFCQEIPKSHHNLPWTGVGVVPAAYHQETLSPESRSLEGHHRLYALLKIASVGCSDTCAVSMQDVVQCLGRVRQGLQPEGRRGGAVPAVHHTERQPLCICLGQHAALHQRLPGAPLGAAPATLSTSADMRRCVSGIYGPPYTPWPACEQGSTRAILIYQGTSLSLSLSFQSGTD